MTVTCRSSSTRVEHRILEIHRLGARVELVLAELRSEHPIGGRVLWLRENMDWESQPLRVRKRVGSVVSDFSPAITLDGPDTSGNGGEIELPGEQLVGIDAIVVDSAGIETGALAGIGFVIDYSVEPGAGGPAERTGDPLRIAGV